MLLAIAAMNGCLPDTLRPLEQLEDHKSIPFARIGGTQVANGSRFLLVQYGDGAAAETLWVPLDAAMRPLPPFAAADGYDPFIHAVPDTQIAMISPAYRQTVGGVLHADSEPIPPVLRARYMVATAYRLRADGTLQVVPLPAANPAGISVPDAVPAGAIAVLLPAKRPPVGDLQPLPQVMYSLRDIAVVIPNTIAGVANVVYLLVTGPFYLWGLSHTPPKCYTPNPVAADSRASPAP